MATYDITLRMYIAVNNELAKLQMIDAFRRLVPYSQTLSHSITFDAYFTGHQSGSYHAWNAAGKTGRPPAWPDPELELEEGERGPAMERDMEELGATVGKYGEFLPELLDKLERDLATNALSLWEGFSVFCEECVGVPAEKVIAVVLEPVVERIEELKSLAERLELEPDTETVEQVREGLAESWRVVEQGGRLVGIRGRLRKLESAAQEELIEIPQRDGTVKRFPQSALMEAFLYLVKVAVGGASLPESPRSSGPSATPASPHRSGWDRSTSTRPTSPPPNQCPTSPSNTVVPQNF